MLYATLSYGNIYQYQNENGEYVFTSNPPPDVHAKVLMLQPINTVSPVGAISPLTENPPHTAKLSGPTLQQTETSDIKTQKIAILKPEDGAHIHTFEPFFPLKTKPSLRQKAIVYLRINGQRQVLQRFQNGNWMMPRPYPGTNIITLSGFFADGKAFQSKPITLYVHR